MSTNFLNVCITKWKASCFSPSCALSLPICARRWTIWKPITSTASARYASCNTRCLPGSKFEQQLKVYTARYLNHMRREETEILPRAVATLGTADWAELDEAFGSHQDPLAPRAGQSVDEAYAPLRQRILAALPAPLGWGPALD